MLTLKTSGGVLLMFLALSAHATAAPIVIVDATGQLTGARQVAIEGAFYDVEFLDGSCVAVFSGCNSESDFQFVTMTSAFAAARALLDTVFVDGVSGLFGSLPGLTYGCESVDNLRGCHVFIPWSLSSELDVVTFSTAQNEIPGQDQLDGGERHPLFDTGTGLQANLIVYARWSPASVAPTPVPEPGTIGLVSMALAALAVRRRRRAGR